jgi:hypothetical protein
MKLCDLPGGYDNAMNHLLKQAESVFSLKPSLPPTPAPFLDVAA